MSASAEMPKYKCHKIVWALKIERISLDTKSAKKLMHFEDLGYAPIELPGEFYERHKPENGGYYVVYEDGYKSFSPARAFEEGYALFEPEMKRPDFQTALKGLLNGYSMEKAGANTPDFLLAEYLTMCLTAYGKIVRDRDKWYGKVMEPGK